MRKSERSDNLLTRPQTLARFSRSAVALFLISTLTPAQALAADQIIELRGTTGPADAYVVRQNTIHSDTVVETAPSGQSLASEVAHERLGEISPYPLIEAADGLRSSVGSTMKNAADALLFSDKYKAVEDRDVVLPLPDRLLLRQSMLHSVSFDFGLRTATSTVGDTVSAALRGSYSSRERLERANAERARVNAAIGNFLPKLTATAEASRGLRNSLASGTYRQDVASVGLEASMPIYTSGVNTNTYRQARNVAIAADFSYLAEEHRASLEAVTAHINLRLNRRVEKALADNVKAMKSIQKIAQNRFTAGDASKTDIAVAQANVEGARSELDVARRTREETQLDYKSVTGRNAPRNLKLTKASTLIPGSLEQAVASAMANNPDLQAARHTALASDDNARVVRGRFGPQVDAFGRYDKYLYDTVQPNRQDDYTFGVRLRIPLVDFSSVPTIEAARHEAAESGYRALDQGRRLRREVGRQWSGYQSAKRRVGIAQRQVKAVKKGLEGARREYQAGFRSIADVLNEQVTLARAQIALQTAIHEKMLAAYQLAFSVSGPNIQHLALKR